MASHRQPSYAFEAIDLLEGLGSDALAEVKSLARIVDVPAGRTIVEHLDPTRDIFFILRGEVQIKIFSDTGREISFRKLGPGGSFGELSAIDGEPRSASVIAATDARVARISSDDFMWLLGRHPPLVQTTMRKLTSLVRSLSDRINEFSTPVQVRICAEFLRLAYKCRTGPTTACIKPKPRRNEIASLVNTHQEAVSRTLSELKRTGIVEVRRGELLVLDLAGLAKCAQRASHVG